MRAHPNAVVWSEGQGGMSEAVFHPEKSQEGFLEVSNSDLTTDSRLVGGRTLSRGQNDVRACLSQKYLAAKNVLCSLGMVELSP